MKKLLAPVLALALCLALSVPALAAETAVPSQQALIFDSYAAAGVSAYNINGYNYFRLRDIAALMSGTAGEFSVDWDAAAGTATLTTGRRYVFTGSELASGAVQSAAAVPSPQTVLIDGEKCGAISIYNIGGYNYFKLRDLGEALGFAVDYDEAWNAAIISPPRSEWQMVKETRTADGSTVTITFTSDENGRLTGYSADDGSFSAVNTFNEYGVLVNTKSFGGQGEDAWENETSYNGRGARLRDVSRSAYSTDTTTYTYNSRGVLTCVKTESVSDGYANTYTITHEDVYNDQGFLIRTTNTSVWKEYGTGETAVTDYTYDGQGRTVAYQTTGSGTSIGYDLDENGDWIAVTESFGYTVESNTVYEADRSTETVHNVYTYADGSKSVTDSVGVTVYDADGNVLSRKDTNVIDGETEISERRYTYNEAGDVLTEAEYYDGSETPEYTETYTYDAEGRMLTDRTEYGSGSYIATYTYDELGNCIAYSYESRYSEYDWETGTSVPVVEKSSSTYAFDEAGRPVLYTTDSDGEHYERALCYDAYGNLLSETVTINGTVTETTVYTYQRST